MARLDTYSDIPSGMKDYLSFYGWHFSKKMCDWAVSHMYKDNGGKIDALSKDAVEALLRRHAVTLKRDSGYDAVYVANMCVADYLGSSVPSEKELAKFIKDTIDDPDGYEGMPFTRFYADCVGSGNTIIWEDML